MLTIINFFMVKFQALLCIKNNFMQVDVELFVFLSLITSKFRELCSEMYLQYCFCHNRFSARVYSPNNPFPSRRFPTSHRKPCGFQICLLRLLYQPSFQLSSFQWLSFLSNLIPSLSRNTFHLIHQTTVEKFGDLKSLKAQKPVHGTKKPIYMHMTSK